tara:strand:- start:280 stop:4194 length:3915 start_codon:yes stop_codon:yes gene_type:complete
MKSVVLILLTITSFLSNSFAQSSPGGISTDLKLWLDAKDNVNIGGIPSTNGGNVDTWVNQVINLGCIDLNQAAATKMPTYETNALNFNPIVKFDGANDKLDRSVLGSDIFNASNNTIFLVHKFFETVGTHVYFKWEENPNGTASRVGFENSGLFSRFDSPTGAAGNQTVGTFAYDTVGQIITTHSNSTTSVLRNLGAQSISNPITGTLNTAITEELAIGENTASFTLSTQIDFAEVIIFNRELSAIEMNKVESYLAIKYGMTLGVNGTSLNYNSSVGTVIWDAGLNVGYNFDIAGISRDDLSDQDQRKSKSINELVGINNDILTIANGANFANPVAFGADMSHLVWGHNGAALTMNNPTTFSTTNGSLINVALDRHWKSQETGALGTTTLHFELANVAGFTNWSDLKLLVDNDGIFTTGSTSFTPSFIDSTGALTIEFEHDFSIPEGFYFTLATSSTLSINNPLPVVNCDTFTLLPITGINLLNPQYYSDTSGTGVVIPLGTVINTDSIIYLYDETGGVPNQFDEDTLNITINISPTVTVPLDISYCAGGAVPASFYTSLPTGSTYEWFHTNTSIGLPNTILTAGNTPGFAATNTTLLPDTSIVYVIPTLNTCPGDTVDYLIIVNPTPAAPTSSDELICINNTATLTATAPGGIYEWHDADVGGTLLFTGPSYTTPILTVDDTSWVQSTINNCTGPRTEVIAEIGLGLLVEAGTPVNICAGEVANLAATPNAATNTYEWSGIGTTIVDTFFNLTVTPTDTTQYIIEITDVFGCIGKDSVTVNVKPTPLVTVPADAIYCNGIALAPSNYSSIPAGATYTWSNTTPSIGLTTSTSQNTPGFTTTNATTQILIDTISVIPSYLGCVGDTVDYTITVNPIPTLIPQPNAGYCVGDTVPVTYLLGTPLGSSFTWTNTNITTGMILTGTDTIPSFVTTNTTFLPNTGVVSIIPTANGCIGSTSSFLVTVSAPIIIDRLITHANCFGSNDGEIRVNPSGGTPGYIYSWTTGETDSIASNLSPGPVTVTVKDTYNCFQDSTFNIVEPDSIDYISFYATPREGCSPLEVQFNCTIDPAQHLLQNYVWDFGNNLVPQDTFIAQSIYETAGAYNVSLTVTDFSGCSNTLTLNDFITVFEDPEAHFNTLPQNPTMLNPTIAFSDVSYPNVVGWEWQFDTLGISNYESPSFTFPEDSGNYYITLIVEDENTCRDTLTRIVSIRSEIALFFPTSFTPNGDGLNDTFSPKGFGIAEENFSFLIFNRWGELVFETNNVLEGWDGSFKGDLLPSGVYIWRADFRDLNGKEYRKNGQMNILK